MNNEWTIEHKGKMELISKLLYTLGIKPYHSQVENGSFATMYTNIYYGGNRFWCFLNSNCTNHFTSIESFLEWWWGDELKPRETIELNGKKYYKEELETALKHIKPIGE